jgi:hypothetical protein
MARRKYRQPNDGEGVRALLEVFDKIGPYDLDLARFARLDDAGVAFEIEDALIRLPELRREFAYKVLHTIMRGVMNGGGWQYWTD